MVSCYPSIMWPGMADGVLLCLKQLDRRGQKTGLLTGVSRYNSNLCAIL